MNNSYNLVKSIKDKEKNILSYYKKIYNTEQPKIFIVPKRKKGTKKNLDNTKNKETKETKESKDDKEDKEDKEDKKKDSDNSERKEDEKKLTKKRVVDMGD